MKKFKFFVLFGFVLILALVSCDGKNNNSTDEPIEDPTYYSVIFDTQGGSSIDSQSVKEGNKVKRPDNPVKKGYQFNYWLNDNKIYNFSSGLSSDIVLVADWTPLKYQLSLISNLEEASTLIGTGKYYVDSEVTIDSKTNPGYIFVGWYKGNALISNKEKYTFDMWSEDLTYEARYTKSTNVQYKVKHYKTSFAYETELVETEVFYGTTGTILNTSDYVKEYENYHWFKGTSSYPLNGDGTTVVEVYYLLDTYNIKLNTNNSQYGVTKLNGSIINSATIEYGTNNTIEAVPNPGYTFIGWFDENGLVSEDSKYTFIMPANDLVYEARFALSTNTMYKVEHYLQNIDNTSYPTTPYEVDELYGTTNASTEATAKTYDGFTAQSVTQQTINPNGTTVVKIYYTRQSKTLTLNRNNTSAGTVTGAGTYKYGKSITIKATANPGYTFIGWYDENGLVCEDNEYSFAMPANNITYDARFTANTNTPYRVEHYLQNIDNTSYPTTPYEVDNLYGTTNVNTEATAKTYDGFTSPSVTQQTISGNGSTVIRLYYARNSYTITIINYFNGNPSKESELVKYEGKYKLEYDYYLGCIISEMYINNELVDLQNKMDEYVVTSDMIFDIFYIPLEEMNIFIFSSTKTALTIKGVKDKNAESYSIPNYVTTIGSNAFKDCINLVSISIPNGVSHIGSSAFEGCINLKSIILPTRMQFIESSAFKGCSSLENITIPKGINSIYPNSFSGCSSLKNVILPSSVERIYPSSFFGCGSLTSITMPLPYYNDFTHLEIGIEYYYALGYIFGDKSFDGAIPISQKYITMSGMVQSINYYIPKSLENVTIINKNYEKNYSGVFENCVMIKNVTLSEDLSNINSNTFFGCNGVKYLTIENTLITIDNSSFDGCTNIEKVYYYGTELEWRRIGYSFADTVTMIYYSETQPTDTGNYWHYVDGVVTEW